MKKVIFIKNAMILTATSLFLRFLGVIIKVWLAAAIGSEGIGLYQLIFSFYVLAATFATSGICTAVTRLVADEICFGSQTSIKKIMCSSCFLTVLAAAVSTAAVFFLADPIANFIIRDSRAAGSLKILSFSLIFMGISSCIKGYFIARRKTLPPSTSQILEHTIRIVSLVFLVKHFAPFGIEYACYGVFFSDLIAEASACVYLYLFYQHDKHYLSRLTGRESPDYSINRKILHIAAPITSGKYINSILRTVENSLVPARLALHGLDSAVALSSFGMIKGMVLPILFFPSSLLNAFSTLLIPEVSEALSHGRKNSLAVIIEYILRITAIVGFLFGAIFYVAGDEIGMLVYKDASVGRLIVRLSPIVPLMYLDSIADGMLKGMDQQLATFRNSVIDSSLRIVLVLLLLEKEGIDGFIWVMYISNVLTCLLNVFRLIRCSGSKLHIFSGILLPISSAAAVTILLNNLLRRLPLSLLAYVSILVITSSIIYFLIILASKSISLSQIKNLT